MMRTSQAPHASNADFHQLRQRLWDLTESLDHHIGEGTPAHLWFRRIVQQQVLLQIGPTSGVIREAALLAGLEESHSLRRIWADKANISLEAFAGITLYFYGLIIQGRKRFRLGELELLVRAYGSEAVATYLKLVAPGVSDVIKLFRELPDSSSKVASEYYEFPALARVSPMFQRGTLLECWHHAVFYRGLEGFVHETMKSAGQDYTDRFGHVFEQHIVECVSEWGIPFSDERSMEMWLPPNSEKPDIWISFDGANVLVECKAGAYDEDVMTAGNSEFFFRKTRSIRKAIGQAWAAIDGLRARNIAPPTVCNENATYLLVVTNRELMLGSGDRLAQMWPANALATPASAASRILPLSHIYVISVETLENITEAIKAGSLNLPEALASAIRNDSNPATARIGLREHLLGGGMPRASGSKVMHLLNREFERLKDFSLSVPGAKAHTV